MSCSSDGIHLELAPIILSSMHEYIFVDDKCGDGVVNSGKASTIKCGGDELFRNIFSRDIARRTHNESWIFRKNLELFGTCFAPGFILSNNFSRLSCNDEFKYYCQMIQIRNTKRQDGKMSGQHQSQRKC